MNRALALALASSLLAPAMASAQWDQRFVNPQPAEDDLVLPLPCDGSIVFRKVETPASGSHALADRSVLLGFENEAAPHVDNPYRTHLLGGFGDGAGGEWHYFIGKYEVTADQYEAVMADTCPEPSIRGAFPKTALSWYDAIAFTRELTLFWHRDPPADLPASGRYMGFARLPSEAEWEFAARGGAAVDEAQFRSRLFPMDDDIKAYAWYQGPDSANGTLKPIGVRKANPLGLHDVLGLAEEFVLTPYKMNKVGRPHGQTGGVVTRGGSILTPREELRTALRQEYSYFSQTAGAVLTLETFGMRVVLSAPVSTSAEREEALRAAWLDQAAAPADQGTDVVDLLAAIEAESADLTLIATVASAKEMITSERRARIENEERAIREMLRSGSIFSYRLFADHDAVDKLESGLVTSRELLEGAAAGADQARIERYKLLVANGESALADARTRLLMSRAGVAQSIFALTDLYPAEAIEAQGALLRAELETGELAPLARFLDAFQREALAYREDRGLDADALVEGIISAVR